MSQVPEEIPVTMPVLSTVAMDMSELVQSPPGFGFSSISVVPAHRDVD